MPALTSSSWIYTDTESQPEAAKEIPVQDFRVLSWPLFEDRHHITNFPVIKSSCCLSGYITSLHQYLSYFTLYSLWKPHMKFIQPYWFTAMECLRLPHKIYQSLIKSFIRETKGSKQHTAMMTNSFGPGGMGAEHPRPICGVDSIFSPVPIPQCDIDTGGQNIQTLANISSCRK